MKLIKYLNYRRLFILAYLGNVLLISLVIQMDPVFVVSASSIDYYHLLSSIIFVSFLAFDYLKVTRHVKNLQSLVKRDEVISTLDLLDKDDYLKREYHILFEHLYNHSMKTTQQLVNEKKDFEDFLSSWIHAIKTPITGLRLKQETDIFLDEKIAKEVDAIDYYVEQALFYHRLGSFSKDYVISESNLQSVTMKSIKKFSRIFINKGISLETDLDEVFVLSDEKWLAFIVSQIISNALKYTAKGGEISITVKDKSLTIKDTGIGIPENEIYRIFEKGFTGSNGRVEEQSTGMGLYLSHKMLTQLGHTIDVQSATDEGTCMTICFEKRTDYHYITKL